MIRLIAFGSSLLAHFIWPIGRVITRPTKRRACLCTAAEISGILPQTQAGLPAISAFLRQRIRNAGNDHADQDRSITDGLPAGHWG
jgi:hypothetical protein